MRIRLRTLANAQMSIDGHIGPKGVRAHTRDIHRSGGPLIPDRGRTKAAVSQDCVRPEGSFCHVGENEGGLQASKWPKRVWISWGLVRPPPPEPTTKALCQRPPPPPPRP